MKLALVLLTALAVTPAFAKQKTEVQALVLNVNANSASSEAIANGQPNTFSETSASFDGVMSTKGSGPFAKFDRTSPELSVNEATKNGDSTITTFEATASGFMVRGKEVHTVEHVHVVIDYAGPAKIISGSLADYQAGRTIKIEMSPEYMKDMLSKEAILLGASTATMFESKTNYAAASQVVPQSASATFSGNQTCDLSLQKLVCKTPAFTNQIAVLVGYRH